MTAEERELPWFNEDSLTFFDPHQVDEWDETHKDLVMLGELEALAFLRDQANQWKRKLLEAKEERRQQRQQSAEDGDGGNEEEDFFVRPEPCHIIY